MHTIRVSGCIPVAPVASCNLLYYYFVGMLIRTTFQQQSCQVLMCAHVKMCLTVCIYIFAHIFSYVYIHLFLYSGLWETVFRSLCLYTQTGRLTIKLTLTLTYQMNCLCCEILSADNLQEIKSVWVGLITCVFNYLHEDRRQEGCVFFTFSFSE